MSEEEIKNIAEEVFRTLQPQLTEIHQDIENTQRLIDNQAKATKVFMVTSLPMMIAKKVLKCLRGFFGFKMSVSDLSLMIGKSPGAIYKMIYRDQIVSRQTDTGKRYFLFKDIQGFLTDEDAAPDDLFEEEKDFH